MSFARTDAFKALAAVFVPEAVEMSVAEWQQFATVIESAAARRPARMQRQLKLFLRIVNLACLFRYGRSLAGASAAQRHNLLTAFEQSRVLLLRRGLWGVRTLVFMGYYARPEVGAALGYQAAPRGWELRR